MQISLEQQIADYQQMVETTRQDGRALRHRLEQEGWTMLERVFDYDGAVMISPELMAHEDWKWHFFDDNEDLYHLDYLTVLNKTENDWSGHIVELPVMD